MTIDLHGAGRVAWKALRRRARTLGARLVTVSPSLADAVVHRAGSPTLSELYELADTWHTSAATLVMLLDGDSAPSVALLEEATAAVLSTTARCERGAYPDFYVVEPETARFLYVAVRRRRPQVVVETGVGDGFSTAVILAALRANGTGVLHSVDVAPDVGTLVTDTERWHLHLVSRRTWKRDLQTLARDLRQVDFFFHDADHDYVHQRFEYDTFWPRMSSESVFVSDDVDASYAFLDLVADVGGRAAMLLDRRKVAGVLLL